MQISMIRLRARKLKTLTTRNGLIPAGRGANPEKLKHRIRISHVSSPTKGLSEHAQARGLQRAETIKGCPPNGLVLLGRPSAWYPEETSYSDAFMRFLLLPFALRKFD